MKILSINPLNNYPYGSKQNYQRNYMLTPLTKIEEQDVFVKSAPSFKAGGQQIGKELLGNNLMQMFSKFAGGAIATAFVAFLAQLGYDVKKGEGENAEFDLKAFQDIINASQNNRDEKKTGKSNDSVSEEEYKIIKEENERLKSEKKELETKLEEYRKAETAKKEIAEKTTVPKEQKSETETVHVIFPAKRGIMSPEQKRLKEIVTRLNISPEYNAMLTEICQDILKKGCKDIENKKTMINLAAELEEGFNHPKNLKKIIDNYYTKGTKETDSPIVEEKTIESPKEDIYRTESERERLQQLQQSKIKVVGFIDPASLDTARGKRKRMTKEQILDKKKAEAEAIITEVKIARNYRLQKDTATITKDENKDISISAQDIYTFKLPDNYRGDLQTALRRACSKFKKYYINEKDKEANQKGESREYIKWMTKSGFENIDKLKSYDIIQELNKTYYDFDNIKESNAEAVAEAINGEPLLKELFTLHGAMRLIERFGFNKSGKIDKQMISKVLNSFVNVAERAMTGDGTKIVSYQVNYTDEEGNTKQLQSSDMIITPDNYNKEDQKYFGSLHLRFGFCKDRYSENIKICTIFLK